MSGGFWAGSVPPWASVVIVLVCMATFVLGIAAGMDLERRQAARDAREERAEKEAGEFIAELRPLPPRPPRARRTSTAAFLNPGEGMIIGGAQVTADDPIDYGQWKDGKPWHWPEVAHEWEPAHVGAALAVANGDPITTGEIRAITEGMDVFMARLLGEHPVPWPDGSGQ